jgi:hypothetical protein
MPTAALELEVSTTIPEYIMVDHLNLTGSYCTTVGSFVDDDPSDFSQGTIRNLTVLADSLELEPSLDVTMLNGGNPVFRGGSSSDWDYLLWGFDMIKVNGIYTLFYAAGRYPNMATAKDIGVATSTDGISFTRYSSNPVLTHGSHVSIARPVPYYNGTWHMYYTSHDGGDMGSRDRNGNYAYSDDGIDWTEYASNPVLPNGDPDSLWDGLVVDTECILNDNGTYMLYYTGDTGSTNQWQTGLATSTDGVTWSKDPNNPVYSGNPGGWDGGNAKINTIEMANGTFRAFVSGDKGDSKVGWIWSRDGINWQDSGSAFIGRTAGTIYSTSIGNPMLLDEGDHYKLYAQCMPSSSWADRTIGCFKLVPENLDGTYTSRVFDAGGVVKLINATWDVNFTVTGDLGMHIRYGNTIGSMGGWRSLDTGDEVANVTARYFQYRIDLDVPRDWMKAYINRVEINYEAFVETIEVSVDGGPWQDATIDEWEWYLNASLHDGDYIIEVKVTDSLGDSITRTIPVKVDLYDPVLDLVLEGGRYATISSTISYTLAGEDTHGPLEQMISFRPDFMGAQWEMHAPVGALEYGGSDGIVEVYAKLKDDAGRISITQVDTIILDTTPPIGSLLIEGGAIATNDPDVMLDIMWTDLSGVVEMMISNDPDFGGALWQTSGHRVPWRLNDVDGSHTVYVRLLDVVGWTTDISSDIMMDRTPPSATLTIDGDATYTTTRDVTLGLTFHDENPVLVKFSNAGDPWPEFWRDLASPIELPWELAGGDDGLREVRMLVRDAGGNEIVVSDDILLDTTPPDAELTVAEGNRFISELLVDVNLVATDATSGMAKMRMSNTGYFTDVAWKEYVEGSDWLFPEGDGMKTLFVQVMDGAGLITTLDTTVIMDTTAPKGTFTINEGGVFVQTSQVTLRLDFEDDFGLDVVRASNSVSFEGALWVAYIASISWDLVEEGERVVYLEVRDEAGNVATSEATIIYDGTPPVIEFLSPKKNVTTEEKVTVEVSVTDNVDNSPLVDWRIDEGAWETLVGTSFQIKLADGDHSIEVRSTDGAGNVAVEALELEKETEPSIASSLFLWIIVVVVVVVIAVGYWQWKGMDSS